MQAQPQDLKNGLATKANSLAKTATEAAAPIADQISDNYEAFKDYAVESYDSTLDYVKKNPGKSLAAAVAVGALAGFLLRSRR